MKGQFFIMATVIMIYTLMTMTNYIYDFSAINLVQLKKMPQLFYIKDIKNVLNQTVMSSSQSLDCNKLETDINATEKFLEDEMISRGILLTIYHNIDCPSLSASFDISLSAPEFYVSSGSSFSPGGQPPGQPSDAVLRLGFNEARGITAYDSSASQNNGYYYGETFSDGSIYSGSTLTDLHTNYGKYAKALKFDGINDYADFGNSGRFNTTSLTVMLWLKLASDPNCPDGLNNWRSLIRKNSTSAGGTSTGWDVILEEDRKLTFDIGNGTAWQNRIQTPPATVPIGNWVHLAFVYNRTTGNQSIYVNGLLNASRTVNGVMQLNTAPVQLSKGDNTGACTNGGGYVNGTVDEVRIWNRSLNSTEIQAEMQSSLPTSRPVASYSFEEPDMAKYVNDTHIWINGTLNGTYDSSLSFDGVNDYVSVPDDGYLDGMPNITVMAWFKLNQLASAKGELEMILVKKNVSDPWNSYYIYQSDATDNLYFVVRNSSGTDATWTNAGVIKANQLYHVTGVYDGSNVMIYLNGTLKDTQPLGGDIYNSNDALRIGVDWYGGNRLNGTIDEVRVWDRVLSPSEIVDEMNKG